MGTMFDLARRMRAFVPNEKGNVAMLFALACLVIFPLVGFAIDFSRTIVDKHKLQMATDSAVLAAAHDGQMTPEQRTAIIESYVNHLEEELGREIDYSIAMNDEGLVSLTTRLRVNTTISKIMGRDYIDVTVQSDAIEGGSDIEVAVILDVTGSMAGSRILALREAANELVTAVVHEEQEPYYSKASIVPYSAAVNVGSYLTTVRGAAVPAVNISAAAWQTGLPKLIVGASKTNPVTITSPAHGLVNGDTVWISGVNGMTQINNRVFTVSSSTVNTFRLSGVNGSSYSDYSSGGTIRKCLETGCRVRVTANGHGLANGEHVVINGVNGMTEINRTGNQTWVVNNPTTDTFVLNSTVGPNYGTYTSGGRAWCTRYGCEYFRHTSQSGGQRVYRVTGCVTERTGDDAFTAAPPSDSPVGFHYPSASSNCPVNQLVPLTSDRNLLSSSINALTTNGTTAGNIGAEWGWYTLSPDFGAIFPADSVPAAYNEPRMQKFAVFMTDGEFNTAHCNGVLSQDSAVSSSGERINCNATNGTSFAQFAEQCTGMKNNGVKIYTVGFEVGGSTTVRDALIACASGPQNAYFATGAEELTSVFQQIARSINEVRLVR